MDRKTLWLRGSLVVVLVISLGYLGFGSLLNSWRDMRQDPADCTVVYVANRYIPAYSILRTADLVKREYPKAWAPPGAIRSETELKNEVGQALFSTAVAVPEGHPLTRAILIDTARSEALGALVGPGRVAVSFEVQRAHGVGGWIKPGDTVAVFSKANTQPRMLFASLFVLAVDHERLGERKENKSDASSGLMSQELFNSREPKVLTVLATAREATTLIEARDTCVLSVALRSPGDDLPWPAAK